MWRSAMNQIKDSEEEAPPSKTTLCEEHEGQRIHQQRSDSAGPGPGPSCVSMKSDQSMDEPVTFKQEQRRIHQQGPDSAGPGPSCVSMKSDWSMDQPVTFKQEQRDDQQRTEVLSGQSVQQHGADLDSIFKVCKCTNMTLLLILKQSPGASCINRAYAQKDGVRLLSRTDGMYKNVLGVEVCASQRKLSSCRENLPRAPQTLVRWRRCNIKL
uniref:uncharacterized protein LOC122760429 isoform X2 n=1 Tax=Solea senegalensis TaxID=28829 RepID=UPI001CD84205|nr:uncharacterized protein LOC122760429 isoform X2 [Solea senegalensis]